MFIRFAEFSEFLCRLGKASIKLYFTTLLKNFQNSPERLDNFGITYTPKILTAIPHRHAIGIAVAGFVRGITTDTSTG